MRCSTAVRIEFLSGFAPHREYITDVDGRIGVAMIDDVPNRRRRWIRILVLVGAAVVLAAAPISCCVLRELGGAFDHSPEDLADSLSPEARALVEAVYRDVDESRLEDYHVHVLGLGKGGTGCFVHPAMLDWTHPWRRIRFMVFASAAGVNEQGDADRDYMTRLRSLVRSHPRLGIYHLLAFDKCHDAEGNEDLEHTDMYVPNDYVFRLAREDPDVFRPTVSIHPYRKDAVAELERCHAAGARYVKWIPSAMRIDPADARCEPLYRRMAELGMVLLTHVGEEQAVEASEMQALGNPLRLRRALDAGVKVLAAHCASLGEDEDLDDPDRPRVPSFDLLLRMFEEEKYEGLLFGDISSMTQANRIPHALTTLLARPDLHDRLVNGSDYPMPAVNVAIRTRVLVRHGYITAPERELLNELYDYNALLFDFAVKRVVRHPETGVRFPPRVFEAHPDLP